MKTSELLRAAQDNHYGIGSFSPRNTFLIEYILRGAEAKKSPVIVQISANEFNWFKVNASEFGKRFYEIKDNFNISAALHLDHTKNFDIIKEAIEAGFTSVMIDASDKDFEENIKITKEVVEYAHSKGAAVEAELGKIGATDKIETDNDEELYTVPEEAKEFVERTNVDALAISIGTAHGVYNVKDPKIDFDRLKAIRALTDVPLVLHGGSGLPPHTVQKAIKLEEGGVSKINIATDLEQVFLKAIGSDKRLLNEEIWQLDRDVLARAGLEVQKTVEEKIELYLGSQGKMTDFFKAI
jgi:ketose-bisphosphate aldolase